MSGNEEVRYQFDRDSGIGRVTFGRPQAPTPSPETLLESSCPSSVP